MIGNRSGAMRLERLYGSLTDNSKAGMVRKAWREHLGVDEDELRLLARTLAFGEATDTLDALRDHLDILFGLVGLRRITHLFIAAPNAFTFFLGQRQLGLGTVRLYEFDFDGGRNRSYEPALTLPLAEIRAGG